jgi:NarL family two-component system sensor histidine kinase YdfH
LAGLILQLEAVDAHLGNQRTERARAILQQSMEKARGTLAEARQVIDNLRRSVEHDLIDQVRQECEHFSSSTGIPCELQMDLVTAIPDEVAEVANKVISEALANIARHARASRVSLRIASPASGKGMTIEIGDNGIGFEPEAVEAGHYGLLGMRERVRLAGGHLTINSAKGKGTCLLIDLPFNRAAEPEYMSSEPKSEAGV